MLVLNREHEHNVRVNIATLQSVWGVPLQVAPSEQALSRLALESGLQGVQFRVQTDAGRWVVVHGRQPAEDALTWWKERVSGAGGTTGAVVMIGAGLGYGVAAALADAAAVAVLVIEHDPARAQALLAARDWRPWIEQRRFAVLVGPDYVGRSDIAAQLFSGATKPLVLAHPVLQRAYPTDALASARVAKALVSEARHNQTAHSVFAERYLLNTLSNLGNILASRRVSELTGLGTGQAAIVAGAGPSLNRNIVELLPFRDRAIIIAAGSAVRPLREAGIEADVNVALDPADLTARNLAGTETGTRAVLVAEGSVPAEVFRQFRSRTFAFRVGENHPWPWLAGLGIDPGCLRAWGSVITSAFDLAVRLGCNPIVLVGADHSYTGGQPYCRQTTWEGDWRYWEAHGIPIAEIWRTWKARQPLVMVTDVHGDPVESATHLLAYRDWLVEASIRAAPVRVVNATGAGILMGGRIASETISEALAGCATATGLGSRVSRVGQRAWPVSVDRVGLATQVTCGAAGRSVADVWQNDVPGFDLDRALAALESGLGLGSMGHTA
ncbi:MAG: DUF115 domain-containing protein [Vicinamibacterales bacterium]|nr:DUF115 domain-containing protein [Vicinamibacterales bacterium]